jgi:predicted GNAT family acetyltransferase
MEYEKIEKYTFRNNTELHRFELSINKTIAYVNYISNSSKFTIVNTYIPREFHALNGFGELLYRKIKEYAISKSIELNSICPYFNALMRKV